MLMWLRAAAIVAVTSFSVCNPVHAKPHEETRDGWKSWLARVLEVADGSQARMSPYSAAEYCIYQAMELIAKDEIQQIELSWGNRVRLTERQYVEIARCTMELGFRLK